MKIGVLGVQGSFEEHLEALENLGSEVVLVKNPADLDKISGLIIPGGESTTIGKLIGRFGLKDKIIERAHGGMPVWGTCAGAILMAVEGLELMDISVSRNAYGRQVDSFETEVEFDFLNGDISRRRKIPAIFIRAPKILKVGKKVSVLAKHGGDIVAAVEGNLFVTTFHPELTDNFEIHRWFCRMCTF